MKTKRITFGFLILTLMACNFITQLVAPPTVTPQPTATASQTATVTATQTATPGPFTPAYIPPQCANSALATVAPEIVQALPTAEAGQNPPISQDMQMRILSKLAKIVEQVYVYPDYNGKDWQAIVNRYRGKLEAGLDTETFYQEMKAMIYELGDEHSNFLAPTEVQARNEKLKGAGEYVGVGIYGTYDFEKDSFFVISIFPGSSAEHAGIRSHDSVILVDDLPITQELGNRLRGPECSVVLAKVQSPGEDPRDVMLMRYRIESSVPVDARLVSTSDGSRIGYIFIPTFFDETIPLQVEEALKRFGQLDGLILDLRLNSGGTDTVTYPILEFFTNGKLGQFVSRKKTHELKIEANPIQNSQSVPMIILVGEDTVSFGEIFAGVMQDAGRAKIVGETSLGNVEVLSGYDFEDGSWMWIAAETFHSAFSEANWEQSGIIPDVQAFAPWDTFTFDSDPSVKAAVELLGHK